MHKTLLLRPKGLPRNGLVGYWKFDEGRNLLKYSQQFDNAAWTKTGCAITANSTTGDDGTTTADTITLTVGATQSLAQTVAVTASTTYTFSIWAKLGTAADLKYAIYDLSNSADIVAPTAYGANGTLQRYAVAFTTPVGCTSISVRPVKNAAQDDGETAYLWGAQLEAGSYARTYYPTTDKQWLMDYSKPRKNLLLPNQANGASDGTTTGFASFGGGTLTSDTTEFWQGTRSLKCVTPNLATIEGVELLPNTVVVPSTTYTVSVYLKGTGTVRLGMGLKDDAGTQHNANSCPTVTLTSEWQRVTYTVTGSAITRIISVRVYTASKQAATFYADGWQLEEGSTATAWEAPPNIGILGSTTGADTNDPTWSLDGISSGADDYVKFGPIWDAGAGAVANMGTTTMAFYTPSAISAASTKLCSFALGTNMAVYFGAVAGAPENNIVTVQYDAAGGYTSWCHASDTIAAGWHTLSLIWNGTAYDIWIDGVQKTTTNAGSPALLPLSNAYCTFDGTTYGSGLVRAWRAVWNRTLASSEMVRARTVAKTECAAKGVYLP